MATRDARNLAAAFSRAIEHVSQRGERYGDYAKELAIGITPPAAAQGGRRTGNTCTQGHGAVFHLANRRRERQGAFDVRFGLKNMGVTHAGDPYPDSGHHHLLIDVDQPLDVKEPIPRDKNHLHFGAGETETRIELPPATTHCSWCSGMPSTTPSIPRWSRTRSRSPCFLSARTRSEQKKQGTEKKKEKVKSKKAGIVAGGDTNHRNISSLINSNGSNLFGSHTSIAAEATAT